MKLSYDNITILADLFQDVTFGYESCDCEPEACCTCEDWIINIKIGDMTLDIGDNNLQAEGKHGSWGGIVFDEDTTIEHFEILCAHLGVKLKRIIHPITLFD